jgi:hypothetical protein
MSYLSKLKNCSANLIVDIFFVAIFLIFLFIPISNINLDEKSIRENRNLEKYRPFLKNGKVNYEYGEDFEVWFNDRFNGREKMVFYYNKFRNKFGVNYNNNPKLFMGKDGWIFYRGNDSMRNYQNIVLFSDKELKVIASYLQNINDWAQINGKKFYYLIAPDKHRIYGEYYPDYIMKRALDKDGKTVQLINYLRTHTSVNVIYPYDILYEHKKDGLLYWKTDTHWNELGAYWGYRALMESIDKDFNIEPLIYQEMKDSYKYRGDLSNMYAGFLKDDGTIYSIPDYKKEYTSNSNDPEASDILLENKTKNTRMMIFGDSFVVSMVPYLGASFEKVYLSRREIRQSYAKFIKENVDIIVIEMVERGVSHIYYEKSILREIKETMYFFYTTFIGE